MKRILSVLTIWILVFSGVGIAADISMYAKFDNNPPNKPKITGPRLISTPGPHEWTFKATDPDGDNLFLFIEWGEGTFEDWFGPFETGEEITRNHTYTKYGHVRIRVRAKDIHGAIGDWGSFQFYSISKHIKHSIFFRIIEQFIERFLMV